MMPRRPKSRTIDIGSRIELHAGIHGSLLSDPPAGTEYRISTPDHVFLCSAARRGARGDFRAARDFSVAELIDPGRGRALFHSARWPVLNRRSWVVDLDDLGYPLLWGRSAVDPRQRRKMTCAEPGLLERTMMDRSARMLAAYTHPSCKAILFRTEQGLSDAYRLLQAVATPDITHAFIARCHVVAAVHRSLDPAEVRRKWRDDPLTVVFCGRDYRHKNGRVALAVMRSLAERFPHARFHYVGDAPRDSLTRSFDALPNATFHGALPRGQALRIMAGSHILFHPTRSESFGMVYAEAAAAGLAVVSSSGPSIPHLHELLAEEGVLFVSREDSDFARDEVAFQEAVGRLLAHREAAAAMATANYRGAKSGRLSVRRRNASLETIYRRAQAAQTEPLGIEEIATLEPPASAIRLTSAEVLHDLQEFWRAAPQTPMSVLLQDPPMSSLPTPR